MSTENRIKTFSLKPNMYKASIEYYTVSFLCCSILSKSNQNQSTEMSYCDFQSASYSCKGHKTALYKLKHESWKNQITPC